MVLTLHVDGSSPSLQICFAFRWRVEQSLSKDWKTGVFLKVQRICSKMQVPKPTYQIRKSICRAQQVRILTSSVYSAVWEPF